MKKKSKLTKSEWSLLFHAIDICHSDYSPEMANGTIDKDALKYQKALEKLEAKLFKIKDET